MVDIDELLSNPSFIILGGLGVGMELLGWIISKRMMEYSFPLWQLLIMMAGTVVAAAFFANRE